MNKKVSMWISLVLKSIVFALLLTIVFGYLFGFRAALVIGSSSEPNIHIGSLVIDYKCPYEDLRPGDYITFNTSGYVTHRIISIKPKGEYFQNGETIKFEHCGMKLEHTLSIASDQFQILTMLTNENQLKELRDKYNEWKAQPENSGEDAYYKYDKGPSIDKVKSSQVVGKVIYSLTNTGKFIFFVRNNFLQIIVYGIILYAGSLLLKNEEDYVKLF